MADPGFPTIYISTPGLTLPNITLTEQIRILMNDPAPGNVANNTQLINWIQRSANIMAREGKCYEDETISFALATDVSQYSYLACGLATAGNTIDYVVDIEAIIYTGVTAVTGVDKPAITAQALEKIDQVKLHHLDQNTSGPPRYWCDTGKSIRVWPVPSAAENTFLCAVLFYRNTNILGYSGDDPTTKFIPNHMIEYSIWYALSQVWERKGRSDISRWFRGLFDKFVMYHRQDNLRKPVDAHDDLHQADYTQVQ